MIAHVLAAAIHGECKVIVTFNQRHFRSEHLEPWGVRAVHPSKFLRSLNDRSPRVMQAKLANLAERRGRTISQFLDLLDRTVPEYVAHLRTSRVAE